MSRIQELLPQFEISNLFFREADCLTVGSPRNVETLAPDLVEEVSTERDDVGGVIEPADERLGLFSRGLSSGND
jgi:hypothetical protein